MKDNLKLTSVKILPKVYEKFKENTADTDITLQKLVNRTLDLYNIDKSFKEKINKHNTCGIKNSKY